MPTDPSAQPGIFEEDPIHHTVQQYSVVTGVDVGDLRLALGQLRALAGTERGPEHLVVAIGASLLGTLEPGDMPAGMRPFTAVVGEDGVTAPASQDDLLVWFAAGSADRCLAGAWKARSILSGMAELREETSGFRYFDHLDLTGFEDGTENPAGEHRRPVACIPAGPSAGGSFVLAMRWVHDLRRFEELDTPAQETVIGRTREGSVELDPLPDRCHVERVVMEDPSGREREIYRRSFPYGDTSELGLFFLAFSADLSTFSDMLDRMYGLADGKVDRLTAVTRSVSGSYYLAPSTEALDSICGMRDRAAAR